MNDTHPTPLPSSFGTAGRYQVRRELGRGMMGVVYEAEDTALGRTVALKTIELAFAAGAQERDEFERRFFIEAHVAAKLSHPGIVVCHDVGKDPDTGKLFIVFEHLKGRTVAQRVREGGLDWREAAAIVAQAARAIHHAHEHGVIHRDLKPANLMLLEPGERVKIMDFGVAKVESAVQLTAAGQTFGSPLYMSPEQALGHWSDARSDIFALGSILCTLLLDRPWFDAPNVPGMLDRVIRADAPRLSSLVAGLPVGLDAVGARALAKRAEDRYPSAAAMADDLEDILAGRAPRHVDGDEDTLLSDLVTPAHPATAHPSDLLSTLVDDSPTSPSTPVRKSARGTVVTAIVGIALAAVVGVVVLRHAPPPRDITTAAVVPAPAAATPTEVAATPEPTATELPTPRPTLAETKPTARESVKVPPAAAAPTSTSAPEKSHIKLVVDHPLESGRLVVWIDGVVAFESKLHAEVAKKIVAIKVHKGHLEETLDVEPGRHEIRLEVSWNDSRRVETQLADVAPGATGVLAVHLARVTNDLSLEWTRESPSP